MNRLFRRSALSIQHALNRFDPAARGADPDAVDGVAAPVFILSAPRSGSTLVYQAMARAMEVSVLTNLMAVAPCAMVRLAAYSNRRTAGPDDPLLPGTYGFLPGLHGLSEAGKVIERWFDPAADDAHRRQVRQSLAALHQRTGRPLLVKSLSLATRLDSVAATLPAARIVMLRRDPRFVVRSLLRGQADPTVDADQWEGVQPPGYEGMERLGPVRRTAWQVSALAALLDAGRGLFDQARVVDLGYEAFCAAPRTELARVAAALNLKVDPARGPERLHAASLPGEGEAWAEIERACAEFGL